MNYICVYVLCLCLSVFEFVHSIRHSLLICLGAVPVKKLYESGVG